MALEVIVGQETEVVLHTDGRIVWTSPVQTALLDPTRIELIHDTDENRLGLRRLINAESHMLYVVIDGTEFYVTAEKHLEKAGIEIAEKYSAIPSNPEPLIPRTDISGCIWIDLP